MALAPVWLDEIKQVGNVDDTAALFSESTGRVLVSVGREDDVKFFGLCEARSTPVLRIGVTDGAAGALWVGGIYLTTRITNVGLRDQNLLKFSLG